MRIGIDARPLTVATTGIGRYTAELIHRLARIPNNRLYLYAHRPLCEPLAEGEAIVRTGKVVHPFLGTVFAQTVFQRWIKLDRLDLFWSPRHHLPLAAPTRTVVTVHDLVWRRVPESMTKMGRLLEAILMPATLRKADSIISVSEATARDIRALYPDVAQKVKVILEAPFVSPPAFGHLVKRSEPTILFLGTFEPRKNLSGILAAFKRLIDEGIVSHRLVIAGHPGWRTDVEKLIRDFGLVEMVRVCHPATDEDVICLYEECDFLLLPSFYEGFGLPIIEAMSFGKPVITSNTSSMPEVAGQGAILVDPASVVEITDAMKRLISDRVLHDSLSRLARLQSQRFSWEKAAKETFDEFEKVAKC